MELRGHKHAMLVEITWDLTDEQRGGFWEGLPRD
jgi:hypothetical protein